jgi:pectin methylesterase-like acyl-CoA thioesterase
MQETEAAMLKIIGFLCTALSMAVLSAATLTVDLGGAGDFTDIQSAIDAARDGDSVLVKPGEYVIEEPISFKGKTITVKGEAGAEGTTIRMAETPADPDRASVVVFESGEMGIRFSRDSRSWGARGLHGNRGVCLAAAFNAMAPPRP